MSEGERGVRCGYMSGLSVRLPFGSARGRKGFAPDSPLEETVRSEPVSDVTPSGDGF